MSISLYAAIIFKLGMIRFATSLLVVLLTNILNRVLIVEFQVPATLIAFIFAFQHLATPSGLVAGYLSDRIDGQRPRRRPFILGGMVLSLLVTPLFPYWGLALAAQPQSQPLLWLGVFLFTLFGIGTTVSATAINALLVDRLPEAQRGPGMTLVWILTLLGFIIGSAFFHYLFPGQQLNRLEIIFWLFTGAALAITLLSLRGVEEASPKLAAAAHTLAGFWKISRGFGQSSQALLFFIFLASSIFFLSMHSFILTPYGGEILRLPVGETAKFGVYTSYGTLVGMGAAYLWLQRQAEGMDRRVLSAGLLIGALAFGLLSLSAWLPQAVLGEAGLWLLGLSKGFYNTGLSLLTMRLVHPVFGGVFMGLWNLISGLGLAAGEMTGGFFLDQGLEVFGSLAGAYAAVFLAAGLGLLGCLVLLRRIRVKTYWLQITSRFRLKNLL